jgi:hypothetical protein
MITCPACEGHGYADAEDGSYRSLCLICLGSGLTDQPAKAPELRVNHALNTYRNAVLDTAFWRSHGTHGDVNLENAIATEAQALKDLKTVIADIARPF